MLLRFAERLDHVWSLLLQLISIHAVTPEPPSGKGEPETGVRLPRDAMLNIATALSAKRGRATAKSGHRGTLLMPAGSDECERESPE